MVEGKGRGRRLGANFMSADGGRVGGDDGRRTDRTGLHVAKNIGMFPLSSILAPPARPSTFIIAHRIGHYFVLLLLRFASLPSFSPHRFLSPIHLLGSCDRRAAPKRKNRHAAARAATQHSAHTLPPPTTKYILCSSKRPSRPSRPPSPSPPPRRPRSTPSPSRLPPERATAFPWRCRRAVIVMVATSSAAVATPRRIS